MHIIHHLIIFLKSGFRLGYARVTNPDHVPSANGCGSYGLRVRNLKLFLYYSLYYTLYRATTERPSKKINILMNIIHDVIVAKGFITG